MKTQRTKLDINRTNGTFRSGAWPAEVPEADALTGWALHARHSADHGVPLSDHADYGELLRFAEMCRARAVYVTHGTKRFAADLRRRGIRAELMRRPQMRLF